MNNCHAGETRTGNPLARTQGLCAAELCAPAGWIIQATDHLNPIEKMPSSHSGLVGTGVALDVALDEKQLGAIFKGKQMLDRGVP